MSRSSLDPAPLQPTERLAAPVDAAVQAAAVYDALHLPRKDYAAEAEMIAGLVRNGRRSARSVLDVACGTGEHLRHMAPAFDVQGVDANPAMLECAARKLPAVPLSCGDMRTVRLRRRFDAVTCLFSSIAYMPTFVDLVDAVANLVRHLEEDGLLIVEPWHHDNVWPIGHHFEEVVVTDGGAIARTLDVEVVDGVSILDMNYEVTTGGRSRRFTEEHRLRLYPVVDYVRAMESAGLSVTHDPVGLTGRGLFVGRAASR